MTIFIVSSSASVLDVIPERSAVHKKQIRYETSKQQSEGEAEGALCWQAKGGKLVEGKFKWEVKCYFFKAVYFPAGQLEPILSCSGKNTA